MDRKQWDDVTVREWIEDSLWDEDPISPESFKSGDELNTTTVEQLKRVMELMTIDGTLKALPGGQFKASAEFLESRE